MPTRLLTKEEYLATFSEPMKNVTEEPAGTIDIWPYLSKVPKSELNGHTLEGSVEAVYRSTTGMEHVLLRTEMRTVFLVIVLNVEENAIFGHYLLDLRVEYGLPSVSEGE
jgi:hypothetical protein